MDILNATAQQLTDQARRFLPITGVTKSNPQDRFFLVMGKTGSGKSTFVARCTGMDVTVGHGLYSCTSAIDSYSYTISNPRNRYSPRRIHLIDTPGFNDTNRSDIETLGILASYLGASYANGVRIHGIIMLHPITDNRMGGSSLRNIEMMKNMCGFSSYKNVAVVTTMWAQADYGSPSHDRSTFEQREAELVTHQRFWGELVAKDAGMFRHNESGRRDIDQETRSARRIVSHLIAQSDGPRSSQKGLVLRLQREIIDEGKTLGETVAGIAIAGDLYDALKKHERQLRDLERELKSRLASRDATHAAELQQLKTEIQIKMANAEDEKRALQKSMQDLHEEEEKAWKDKIKTVDREFRAQIAKKEEELEELEESIREIREDAISRWSVNSNEFDEHDEIVRNARRELDDARSTHSSLQSQTGNISNGLANGVAAGVATAVVSGAMAGTLLCAVM